MLPSRYRARSTIDRLAVSSRERPLEILKNQHPRERSVYFLSFLPTGRSSWLIDRADREHIKIRLESRKDRYGESPSVRDCASINSRRVRTLAPRKAARILRRGQDREMRVISPWGCDSRGVYPSFSPLPFLVLRFFFIYVHENDIYIVS